MQGARGAVHGSHRLSLELGDLCVLQLRLLLEALDLRICFRELGLRSLEI